MKKSHSFARRREPLTRERVLGAALTIVDGEGLSALSMRRVGEALGVEAMSLYNHVPGKAALLDGVFELILAELPPARRHRSWKESLRERALALAGVLRAHPNALPLFASRPAVTPASFEHVEQALQTLHDAGFSPHDALSVFQILVAFVVGHTLQAETPIPPEEESHPAYEALREDTFPRVRELAALLPDRDVEEELAMGVDALLEGLDRRRGAAG
jgi:TetR/AcrR family transcriptional regulator, tetracycline repressor protein